MRADDKRSKVTSETRAESVRLMQLWESTAHDTQAVFGATYEIGNQSAVGQFLRGEVPLSLKAASGFARGLGIKIADFSPRLATEAAQLTLLIDHTALDLTKLGKEEFELVQLYRALSPPLRAELVAHAKGLYIGVVPAPVQPSKPSRKKAQTIEELEAASTPNSQKKQNKKSA